MSDYDKFTCSTQDPGLRRDFIGASDAPIIMGHSPYCTPLQLYERKLGISEPQFITPAMQRGIDMEEEARKELSEICKTELLPTRVFSERKPWMMANFDGMDSNKLWSCEIKCPVNPGWQDKVPEKYYAQLQHQLYVSRLREMIYFCYHPLGSKLIRVSEDAYFQEQMVQREEEFYTRLQNFDPPPSTDKDFVNRDDKIWIALTEEYKYLAKFHEEISMQLKESRDQIISACENKSSKGNGVKASKSNRNGAIDFRKVYEDYTYMIQIKEEDLEEYRKKSSESWRITL